MRVHRASSDELQIVRRTRLQALTDEPTCFGTAAAAEPALSEWLSSSALHDWFLASVEERIVGIGAIFFDDLSPDGAPQLGAMWVDPRARRLGVGLRIERAATLRASARGFDALGLWVVEGNDPAAHAYSAYGYTPTGAWKPAPRDRSIRMWRMRRSLGGVTAESHVG